MKATLLWMILGGAILLFGGTANAWGGLFNRFSPEMLANMGYGTHGGGHHSFLQNERYLEPNENTVDDDPCYNRRCVANEDCCPASICIYVNNNNAYCVFVYGRKLGELCRQDADCEAGLVCESVGPNDGMVCRPPTTMAKQYSEDCTKSIQCDITKGLCCQFQRRHRQAPRKVCSYFKDPLTCIGTVAIDQITNEIEHTAGEKRLTSAFKHGLN